MSPEAEALREKLAGDEWWTTACAKGGTRNDQAQAIARTIVEELGITEEMVESLRAMAASLRGWGPDRRASELYLSADRFSTLLELANHGE